MPAVVLLMATRFQETEAMDLKSYKGHTLLHLIDHFTRFSASSVIPNKKTRNYYPKYIQDLDICIWICWNVSLRQQWRICQQGFHGYVWNSWDYC